MRVVDKGHLVDIEALFALRARTDARLTCVPGAWDSFSARLAEESAAPAIFISLGLLALANHGTADPSIIASGELTAAVAQARECTRLPILAGAGGGFGNSLNVIRTVRVLERAGASAIDLSDGVSSGSNSEALGLRAVTPADMIGKLKAALDTRNDALIAARTVTAAQEDVEAALDRCDAYLEAGADLIIVEAPIRSDHLEAFGRRFAGRVPLLYEGADAPPADLEALGFTMNLLPTVLLGPMREAAEEALGRLNQPRLSAEFIGSLSPATPD